MIVVQLDSAVEQYRDAIAILEVTDTRLTKQQIFDVLIARDRIYSLIKSNEAQINRNELIEIVELDEQLKKQASRICRIVQFEELRSSINPPIEAWWWFLEDVSTKWSRLDWLCSGISVTSLTATISLILDISSRFLTGGADTLGAFAVVIPSALTLLTAGGALTTVGKQGIQSLLKSLKIPKHFWHEVSASFAVLLLLSTLGLYSYLPKIAEKYNEQGMKNYANGKLSSALSNLNRAVKLNPDYAQSHYNLGVIYEKEFNDIDRAITEYQSASQAGFIYASNNLAKLYIQSDKKEKYDAVFRLIEQGLDKIQKEKIYQKEKEAYYALLKNYGWVRLKQKRYEDAEKKLRDAIDLAPDKAPAHCLLAQLLENQRAKKSALIEWGNCLNLAKPKKQFGYQKVYDSDEDNWLGMAQKRIKSNSIDKVKEIQQ
jgi:tetratricopeptide (TPR) repeat protein